MRNTHRMNSAIECLRHEFHDVVAIEVVELCGQLVILFCGKHIYMHMIYFYGLVGKIVVAEKQTIRDRKGVGLKRIGIYGLRIGSES